MIFISFEKIVVIFMFATHYSIENRPKFVKIPQSIHFFSNFSANVLSTTSYQSIVTNANILVWFVWKWQAEKDSSFEKIGGKIYQGLYRPIFSVFCCAPIIQYSYLRFCTTKRSHISNVHWKFEDFRPSSLGIIKV